MKHLIDIKDLTVNEIDELIKVAKDIIAKARKEANEIISAANKKANNLLQGAADELKDASNEKSKAVREFNKSLVAYQQMSEGEAKQAEFKRLQEELASLSFLEKVSGMEKVEIGAKADDLYFVVTNEAGEQELKSITEIKLGKILADKHSGMYKDVSLVMLVSPESEPLVQNLYDARPELGTELAAAMERQEMYPVVQLKDGKIHFLTDRTAPGGHGVWPTTLLSRIFSKATKGIMFVGNSDAIASSSIPEVVGWMRAEKVGIAMLSVDREPIDRKGGIFGLLKVDVKDEVLQIVCGAPNIKADMYVIVAKVGCELPGDFKIKKSKIRGVESFGMICSLQELGLEKKYIIDDKEEVVKEAVLAAGLELVEVTYQGEWVSITARKK